MKKIIKTIVKDETKGYHPAVGYYYLLTFTDGTTREVSDDELMDQYKEYRKPGTDVQTLVGKPFNIEED